MEQEIPKSEWGDGPWQNEPDRLEWEYKGFPCLMVRSDVSGSWCGYVAIPPGHPYHGKSYDDWDLDVHGGLTYGAPCQEHICHKPKPGEPDNVFWLGFDCGHAFDLLPKLNALTNSHLGEPIMHIHYWTMEEVKKEVECLADQLARLNLTNKAFLKLGA